jgi:hypothetical protein
MRSMEVSAAHSMCYLRCHAQLHLAGSSYCCAVAAFAGAMLVSGVGNITIKGSNLTANTGKTGAAMMVDNSTASLLNCAFTLNRSNFTAGCLYSTGGSNVTITDTNMEYNLSPRSAALQAGMGCTVNVTRCDISSNTALGTASAITISGTATLRISGSTVRNNTAEAGAGVYMSPNGRLYMDNCVVDSNHAKDGAGIRAAVNTTVVINNSVISNNVAAQSGGGLFQSSSTAFGAVITDTVFSNNSATCCYAAGYGITSSTTGTTCSDTDSGDDRNCCIVGEYASGKQCVACTGEFKCDRLGISTATLPLSSRYWRESTAAATARLCWNADACVGGVASSGSTDEYCAAGYKGPCKLFLV